MSLDSNASFGQVIVRVLQRSGHSPVRFALGVAWRVLERLLDLMPLVLAFFWLQWALESSSASGAGIGQSGLFSPAVLVTILAVLFLLQCLAAWQGQKQSFLGGYAIMAGYRKGVLDQLHRLPLGVLAQYRSGQLADMMTDDIQRIEAIFTHLIVEVLTALLVPIVIVVGLLLLGMDLALALLVGFVPGLVILQLSRNMLTAVSRQKQHTQRQTSGLVVEFITGLRTLRLFDRSQSWLTRLSQQFDQMIRESIGVETWAAGPVVLFRLLVELGLVLLLWLMARQLLELHALNDAALLEEHIFPLLLVTLLAYRVVAPLLELAEHITVVRFALQSEHSLHHLMATPLLPEPMEASSPENFSLSMHHVSFCYPSMPSNVSQRSEAATFSAPAVLTDISFDLKPGSMTAIVGPSGSGKTTLLHLLARFYDPNQGEVRLGGVSLAELGSQCLYQHVSMVLQQVQLFDGTIMENVAMAKPGATEEEVIDACKAAHCDGFIRQLPQGYQTCIGEGGMRLSGGERQRVSIARALLKDAPILLLDEATAALDMENQSLIQQALQQLVQGRTLVVVAHRLSTIRHADQILVLDQGRLVQQGNHDTLIQQEGMYQRLWQSC